MDRRLPYVAFALASLIWGSTFLVIRIGNAAVPPLLAAAIRLVLAAAVLAALTPLVGSRFPRGAQLRAVLIYGALQFGVNFGLLYWGELRVPSGVAAVFYATIPLSTLVFAWGLGVERPTLLRTGAALLALAGVAGIFAGEVGVDVPIEYLLAVLAAATAAALSGVVLKTAPPQDAIPANAIGAVVGAVVCFAASTALGEPLALPMGWDAWWPILYLTAAGSLGAFVIWTWLLKTWRASSASMITVVVPVLALLLGAAVAGERPATFTLAGGVLVLLGVLLVLRAPQDERPAPVSDAR